MLYMPNIANGSKGRARNVILNVTLPQNQNWINIQYKIITVKDSSFYYFGFLQQRP